MLTPPCSTPRPSPRTWCGPGGWCRTRCTACEGMPSRLVPDGDDAAVLQVPLSQGCPAPARRPVRGLERSAAGDLRRSPPPRRWAPCWRSPPAVTCPRSSTAPPSSTPTWSPDLVADHIGVTSPARTRRGDAVADPQEQAVPDALVGLAWPAVFACIGPVEGLLDLVHLDHRITVGTMPLPRRTPGRAELSHLRHPRRCRGHHGRSGDQRRGPHLEPTSSLVARLLERFMVRGRTGAAELPDPAPLAKQAQEATRARLDRFTVTAPHHMAAFAAVSGDHNPLHTDVPAARLAGFDGPIVHGMWLSAVAQRAAASVGATHHPRGIRGWLTRWVAPLQPGAEVEITVERTGVLGGDTGRRGQLPRQTASWPWWPRPSWRLRGRRTPSRARASRARAWASRPAPALPPPARSGTAPTRTPATRSASRSSPWCATTRPTCGPTVSCTATPTACCS